MHDVGMPVITVVQHSVRPIRELEQQLRDATVELEQLKLERFRESEDLEDVE